MSHFPEFESSVPDCLSPLRLGILMATVEIRPSSPALNQAIEAVCDQLNSEYELGTVNQHPVIAEARAAYRKCGNDPNRYRPSADALMRRIVKGMGLYRINNVVDALNCVSLRSGFSIGGYDVSKIEGAVTAGIGQVGEPYTGIGRGSLNINDLPVLRDQNGAFGSPTSDSERTMISQATEKVLMVFFDFGINELLDESLNLAASLLEGHCHARELVHRSLILK